MRRVIGIDTHRTFGEVVIWEDGLLRHAGRIGMTRTALEGFGKDLLATDEVVIEATGNCMAVSRVLTPFVKRVIIANPLQVKAIAHSQAKTDKIDAGTLANLYAAGYLPEIWTPTQGPSGCVGLLAAAIKLCGIGRGSRTRSTLSCTLT
jgi:transposase